MSDFLDIIEKYRDGIRSISHFYASMSSILSEEDVFQEIVYNLFKSYRKYKKRPDCNMSTWVFRVAINVSISLLRKEGKMIYLPFSAADFENEIVVDNLAVDEKEALFEIVKRLDVDEQTLVFLYLEDKTYKEISDILGISVSNVGTRLQRVKFKLKKMSYENK
jgi:RNA polymerase sigma-70 factor (ECF subfamily)